MDSFTFAFSILLRMEGDFSSNPVDKGGETKFGISESVARRSGYHGPMKDLPLNEAQFIFQGQYWAPLKLDTVSAFSEELAFRLFEGAVNIGPSAVVKLLQNTANKLMHGMSNIAHLKVDGHLGGVTLYALYALSYRNRSPEVLFLLQAMRVEYYLEIVGTDPSQKHFLRGWLRRLQVQFPANERLHHG